MLTQGFQKFYGSITEAAEAPETIFQKRENVPEGPRFEFLFTLLS